jgi:hypothetical protein
MRSSGSVQLHLLCTVLAQHGTEPQFRSFCICEAMYRRSSTIGYGTDRWRASALKPATTTSSPAIRSSAWPIPRVYPSAGRTGSDLFRKWPFVQPLCGLLEPHVWRAPTVEGWRTSPCRPRRLRLPRACPRVFPSRFGHNSPHWTSLSGVIGRSRTRIPLAW